MKASSSLHEREGGSFASSLRPDGCWGQVEATEGSWTGLWGPRSTCRAQGRRRVGRQGEMEAIVCARERASAEVATPSPKAPSAVWMDRRARRDEATIRQGAHGEPTWGTKAGLFLSCRSPPPPLSLFHPSVSRSGGGQGLWAGGVEPGEQNASCTGQPSGGGKLGVSGGKTVDLGFDQTGLSS